MNEDDARKTINQMIQFIENEAKEKAKEIIDRAQQEYNIESEKLISAAKDKIKSEYAHKLNQYSIQKRIERSGAQNQCRIKKMAARNRCIEEITEETRKEMNSYFVSHKDEYKLLVKNLIVQGLIKLLEGEVVLKCREEDVDMIEDMMDECKKEYVRLLQTEVPKFKGKEIRLKLLINKTKFLSQFNSLESGLPSSVGGVELYAKNGKIVCWNTVDMRLELVYHEALPEVRKILFPSY